MVEEFSDLEESTEIIQSEERTTKNKNKALKTRSTSRVSTHVEGQFQKEKRENKGQLSILEEIIVNNFSNLMKNICLQIQEAPKNQVEKTQGYLQPKYISQTTKRQG